MRIFAIGDLHLSLSIREKTMEYFGATWEDYINKIEANWRRKVKDDDIVILPGDTSWAMRTNELREDFDYIESLPGTKVILKGNHDYWWTTQKKLSEFLDNNQYKTINFIQNNYYNVEELNLAICGTRGWRNPSETGFDDQDERIYAREVIRLELSLKEAKDNGAERIIVGLHYPPLLPENPKSENNNILNLLSEYGVEICVFGHVHSNNMDMSKWDEFKTGKYINGIKFYLTSSDMISFDPILLL